METVSKNPTEIAKIIRKELKAVFPGQKFSVKTEYFSMGNAVRVSWIDGPTTEMVDSIVMKWQSGRFDGQTDYAYSVKTGAVVDGEIVVSSVKYVTTRREYSDERKNEIFNSLKKEVKEFNDYESLEDCKYETFMYSFGGFYGDRRESASTIVRNRISDYDYSVKPVQMDKAFKMPETLDPAKETEEKAQEVYPQEKKEEPEQETEESIADEISEKEVKLVVKMRDLYLSGNKARAYMIYLNLESSVQASREVFEKYMDQRVG